MWHRATACCDILRSLFASLHFCSSLMAEDKKLNRANKSGHSINDAYLNRHQKVCQFYYRQNYSASRAHRTWENAQNTGTPYSTSLLSYPVIALGLRWRNRYRQQLPYGPEQAKRLVNWGEWALRLGPWWERGGMLYLGDVKLVQRCAL